MSLNYVSCCWTFPSSSVFLYSATRFYSFLTIASATLSPALLTFSLRRICLVFCPVSLLFIEFANAMNCFICVCIPISAIRSPSTFFETNCSTFLVVSSSYLVTGKAPMEELIRFASGVGCSTYPCSSLMLKSTPDSCYLFASPITLRPWVPPSA